MSFKLDIITSEEQFALMRQAWDGIVLSNAEQHTIFQSWAYIFNHWKFRKSGDGFSRTLRLYALYDDASLIAVAPMWINIIRKGLSFRVMEFIGNRGIDYLDFIVKLGIDPQRAIAFLMERILSDKCWDVISFSELREQSASILAAALNDHGTSHQLDKCSTCVPIDIPVTKSEYLSVLGKSTRKRLTYDSNRLEALYNAKFFVYTDFNPEFSDVLNTLQLIHQERWSQEGHEGAFHGNNTKLMDIEINRALAENESLRYFVLTAEGAPVAGMSCAVLGKTIYAHIMSVSTDSQYRRFSPGMVMVQRAIYWAIENKFSVLDLSRGQEPYKFSLGGKAVPNYRITIYRNMLMKALVSKARAMGKPI